MLFLCEKQSINIFYIYFFSLRRIFLSTYTYTQQGYTITMVYSIYNFICKTKTYSYKLLGIHYVRLSLLLSFSNKMLKLPTTIKFLKKPLRTIYPNLDKNPTIFKIFKHSCLKNKDIFHQINIHIFAIISLKYF